MSILDIVILVILVLAAVWGFIRGGKRKVAKWLGIIAGIAVAFLCYQMLGNLIAEAWGRSFAEMFETKLLEGAASDETTYLILSSDYSTILEASSTLKEAFSAAGIPSFFISFFTTKVFITDGTTALAIGSSFASAIIYADCFLGLFIIVCLIVSLIVRKLFSIGQEDGKKTILDRITGLVLSEVKAIVLIFVIMLILVGISYLSSDLKGWLLDQVAYDQTTISISRFFYNLCTQIIDAFRLSIG